jgi:hypothetical protein
MGKKRAAAPTIAIQAQQTRTATIMAMIVGVDEDWLLLLSMDKDLLN